VAVNAIGVDVGGTKIAAGVVTPEGEVLSEARHSSHGSTKQLMSSIVRAVEEVRGDHEVGGLCLAVPGLILAAENKVIFSPNLHSIEGVDLKRALEDEIGLSVTVENDGNAAAWGEFRFGAGSEVDHLVFLTLGTGVGGGIITEGVLLRGAQGAGGELGHVTIQATGPRCSCGNHGCIEALASGTAIRRRAMEVAVEKPDSEIGRLAARREVLGEDVTELARGGDALALSLLQEAGVWLGIGIAGFVNTFNPEVVAVGGGVMAAGDLILEPARHEAYLRARSPSRDLAEIKEATLGAKSGLLGAAALARDAETGEYILGG
jgi:glucokinase